MRVEILLSGDLCKRGERILEAMIGAAPAAGIEAIVSSRGYRGDCPVLMTYGTGHPIRRPYWQKQRRRGGRCIGWDLGYWQREGASSAMRATIDEDHPQAMIRPEPPERWDSQGIDLREDADPSGPILLLGMGIKAARLHAGGRLHWEAKRLERLRIEYPDRAILFRPKRYDGPQLRGANLAPQGPIERALLGCSLAVCRHSNAAVDACIAGVPVACQDGAALALYARGAAPSREERLGFLRSLAWWQWKPEEALAAWKYLITRLSA